MFADQATRRLLHCALDYYRIYLTVRHSNVFQTCKERLCWPEFYALLGEPDKDLLPDSDQVTQGLTVQDADSLCDFLLHCCELNERERTVYREMTRVVRRNLPEIKTQLAFLKSASLVCARDYIDFNLI